MFNKKTDSNNSNDKNHSFFFKNKVELPPLEKRTDTYSRNQIKIKKIIDLMDKFK